MSVCWSSIQFSWQGGKLHFHAPIGTFVTSLFPSLSVYWCQVNPIFWLTITKIKIEFSLPLFWLNLYLLSPTSLALFLIGSESILWPGLFIGQSVCRSVIISLKSGSFAFMFQQSNCLFLSHVDRPSTCVSCWASWLGARCPRSCSSPWCTCRATGAEDDEHRGWPRVCACDAAPMHKIGCSAKKQCFILFTLNYEVSRTI